MRSSLVRRPYLKKNKVKIDRRNTHTHFQTLGSMPRKLLGKKVGYKPASPVTLASRPPFIVSCFFLSRIQERVTITAGMAANKSSGKETLPFISSPQGAGIPPGQWDGVDESS